MQTNKEFQDAAHQAAFDKIYSSIAMIAISSNEKIHYYEELTDSDAHIRIEKSDICPNGVYISYQTVMPSDAALDNHIRDSTDYDDKTDLALIKNSDEIDIYHDHYYKSLVVKKVNDRICQVFYVTGKYHFQLFEDVRIRALIKQYVWNSDWYTKPMLCPANIETKYDVFDKFVSRPISIQ